MIRVTFDLILISNGHRCLVGWSITHDKMKGRNISRENKYVPFVRRFRRPSQKESIAACADLSMRDELKPLSSFHLFPSVGPR